MKEGLTPEEVNVHAIDFVSAEVDTVRYLSYHTSLLKKKWVNWSKKTTLDINVKIEALKTIEHKGIKCYNFSYPELSIGFNFTKTTNTLLAHQKPFLFLKPQVRLIRHHFGYFLKF